MLRCGFGDETHDVPATKLAVVKDGRKRVRVPICDAHGSPNVLKTRTKAYPVDGYEPLP